MYIYSVFLVFVNNFILQCTILSGLQYGENEGTVAGSCRGAGIARFVGWQVASDRLMGRVRDRVRDGAGMGRHDAGP